MDETPGREVPLDEQEDAFDSTLRSLIREVGVEARARQDPHPDPDALIDYSQGALDSEAEERIRSHVEVCSDCASAVLDLGALARFEAEPGDPSPNKLGARWQALEDELARRGAAAGATRSAATTSTVASVKQPEAASLEDYARPARFRWKMPVTWAAAALLATGLFLYFDREAPAPQSNVHVASLTPGVQSLIRGSARSMETLRVPAISGRFVLILNLTDSRSFPRYRLEITRATQSWQAAGEVWSGEDLQRAETGNFTVEFDRQFLAPGRYLFELSGLGAGEPASLAHYAVELVYE